MNHCGETARTTSFAPGRQPACLSTRTQHPLFSSPPTRGVSEAAELTLKRHQRPSSVCAPAASSGHAPSAQRGTAGPMLGSPGHTLPVGAVLTAPAGFSTRAPFREPRRPDSLRQLLSGHRPALHVAAVFPLRLPLLGARLLVLHRQLPPRDRKSTFRIPTGGDSRPGTPAPFSLFPERECLSPARPRCGERHYRAEPAATGQQWGRDGNAPAPMAARHGSAPARCWRAPGLRVAGAAVPPGVPVCAVSLHGGPRLRGSGATGFVLPSPA